MSEDSKLSLATRAALGISQTGFAMLLGVHPITVSKWECGLSNLTPWQYSVMCFVRESPDSAKVRDALYQRGACYALALALNYLLKNEA